MKIRLNQKGFATWELALGVLVIAVIGFAGYHVYSLHNVATTGASNTTPATTAGSGSTSSIGVPVAPTVTDSSGLDQATAALNLTDPSGSSTSDSTQLSSQANSF